MRIENVKLIHLRYYVATVETGSFVSAGKRLNITPTSIAHGISILEKTLGNNFLIRKRSAGVQATQEGKRLFTACRKVLMEMDGLSEEFLSIPTNLSGELIVGCQEGLTWSIAPRVVQTLSKKHPNLKVSVKTIFMDDELRPIEDGDVDLLITFMVGDTQPDMSEKLESGNFYKHVFCRPQPYALMHAEHPLSTEGKEKVWLKDLVNYPHIFIKDGPAFPLFHKMYDDVGLTPNITAVSNISPAAQSIVGRSEAISLRIVRPSIDKSPLGDKLAFLELADKVTGPDVIAVTHKNAQTRISRKAEAFIDICQEKFDNGVLRENFYY